MSYSVRYMRTSLLINCSKKEAQEVRSRAELQRRTVSGYIVNIVLRRIDFADELAAGTRELMFKVQRHKPAQPRTTLHIYCAAEEACRVRRAARLGRATISGLVLNCLQHAWKVEDDLAEIERKRRLRRPNSWGADHPA